MNKKDFIYWIVIGFFIVVCAILFLFMKSEVAGCVKNPFIYGASKMGRVECSCTQKIGACSPLFFFNDTTFIAERTVCGTEKGNQTKIEVDWESMFNITE